MLGTGRWWGKKQAVVNKVGSVFEVSKKVDILDKPVKKGDTIRSKPVEYAYMNMYLNRLHDVTIKKYTYKWVNV